MTRRTINNGIVSKRLIELRTSERLTQKDLSENTGISLNSIKNYECGRRIPDRTNLTILAKYFKVDEAWITGESEYKNVFDKIGYDKLHFHEYAINHNLLVFDPKEDFGIDLDLLTPEQQENLHDSIIDFVKQNIPQ